MHVLLHGNMHSARDGGVSPQLIGRVEALIEAHKREPIYHVYFFADNRYPNGVRAVDFVLERLTSAGFRTDQLTIDPIAHDTGAEVDAFVIRRAARNHRGPVGAVTSSYHADRCKLLLERAGCRPYMIKTRRFGLHDLVLEPFKLAVDKSPRLGKWLRCKLKRPRLAL